MTRIKAAAESYDKHVDAGDGEEQDRHNGATVGVGSLPGRKSKALWVEEGSVIHTVAYFRNDASYERFLAAIKGGTGLRPVNPVEDGEG